MDFNDEIQVGEQKVYGVKILQSTGDFSNIEVCESMSLAQAVATARYLQGQFSTPTEIKVEPYQPKESQQAVKKPPEVVKKSTKNYSKGPDHCGICGSKAWDNGAKKMSGEYSERAPDGSCRDKKCGAIGYWQEIGDFKEVSWFIPKPKG